MIVRLLVGHEAELLAEHLLRLDPESRRLRFSGFVRDESVRAYVAGIDWRRAVILGAFVDGVLRGVCEVVRAGAREAELAVSVEKDQQGRGLGRALVRRAILYARNRGITKLHLIALPENSRLRALVAPLPHRSRVVDGSFEADLPIEPAGLDSLALEANDMFWANIDRTFRLFAPA